MTPAEALDIVVARTGHARFRELCDPSHPDYRPEMVDVVLSLAGAPKPPPLLTRLGNFAGAVASHVAAGLPTLADDQVAARLAVCDGCPQRLPGGVCAGCGCDLSVKATWAEQDCPEGLWPKV